MKLKLLRNCLFVVLSASLLLTSTSRAQDPAPPGPKVELSLIVIDSNKKSINSVRKEDIHVIEDKVEQTVLSVDPDDRLVDGGLVIDASGSVRKFLPAALLAASALVMNKQPSEQFFIERFVASDNISNVQEFTDDTVKLIKGLKSFYVEGGESAVLDAIYIGAEHVAKFNQAGAPRRKVLLLITDGEDRNSYYSLDKIVKQLHTTRVQVFAIGLTMDLDKDMGLTTRRTPREKAEKLLKTVTEETGGRVFFPKTVGEMNDAITQIVTNLRSQFRITYQSNKEVDKERIRKVDVKLISAPGQKQTAIAPRGYYCDAKDVTQKTTEPKSP